MPVEYFKSHYLPIHRKCCYDDGSSSSSFVVAFMPHIQNVFVFFFKFLHLLGWSVSSYASVHAHVLFPCIRSDTQSHSEFRSHINQSGQLSFSCVYVCMCLLDMRISCVHLAHSINKSWFYFRSQFRFSCLKITPHTAWFFDIFVFFHSID